MWKICHTRFEEIENLPFDIINMLLSSDKVEHCLLGSSVHSSKKITKFFSLILCFWKRPKFVEQKNALLLLLRKQGLCPGTSLGCLQVDGTELKAPHLLLIVRMHLDAAGRGQRPELRKEGALCLQRLLDPLIPSSVPGMNPSGGQGQAGDGTVRGGGILGGQNPWLQGPMALGQPPGSWVYLRPVTLYIHSDNWPQHGLLPWVPPVQAARPHGPKPEPWT